MVRAVGVQACWTSATAIWGAGHGGDDCHYGDRGDDRHHGDYGYGYRDHDDVGDGDNHYGDGDNYYGNSVNDHHGDGKVGGGVDRQEEYFGDTDNDDA